MSKNARRGVLVTAKITSGRVRIRLDDVAMSDDAGATWKIADHVTEKELSADDLSAMKFSERDLADFAFFVLTRLSVFADRNEL